MNQCDERIKSFLVSAFQVLQAHDAKLSQLLKSMEAVEAYLKKPTGGYQQARAETFQRIELREQQSLVPGTQSTADLIASMLKAIPEL